MSQRPRRLLALLLGVGAACACLGASPLATPARAIEGSDWQHALRVAQDLRAHPPAAPVVLLLGGSAAREATVSDAAWASAVQARGESPVVTYNLGSRNQTFEQDVALVNALPRIPVLVFIGVNLGRFTSPPTTTTSTTPKATKGTYTQHHYGSARIQSLERKQDGVRYWMRQRYPVFSTRFAANLARLDRLVAACRAQGFRPVLLDLPRNMDVIGEAFDAPITQYQDGCRTLAAEHSIPFIDFAEDVELGNKDFFDLAHLVEPGQAKFQGRLTSETARLLAEYGMQPATGEGWDGWSIASRTRSIAPWLVAAAVVGLALTVQRRRVVVRRRRRARRQRLAARRRRELPRPGAADGRSVACDPRPDRPNRATSGRTRDHGDRRSVAARSGRGDGPAQA
jgi:hypothetical protein